MPVSFKIPGEEEQFHDWLKRGISDGVRRGFLSAAIRTVQVIVTEIIPAEKPPPIFMGAYNAAWRADATDEGADIVNSMPYANIIEYGARAENIKIGHAMIEALTNWVQRKGLAGKPGSSEARTKATGIAWAIATTMKQRGIFNREGKQGLRIGEKAIGRAREFLGEEVAREVLNEFKQRR